MTGDPGAWADRLLADVEMGSEVGGPNGELSSMGSRMASARDNLGGISA